MVFKVLRGVSKFYRTGTLSEESCASFLSFLPGYPLRGCVSEICWFYHDQN